MATTTTTTTTTTTMTKSQLDQVLLEKRIKFLEDFKQGKSKEWTIVMGNEAGDLDSLASSIAYSYFASPSTSTSFNIIPLQLTPRTDLYLRPENLESLAQSNISLSSLLTIDDLENEGEGDFSSLESNYVLVDHNSLLPIFKQSSGDSRVVSIIDHHVDEQQHLSASPRIIEPVGSCSSLITTHFLLLLLNQQQGVQVPPPPKELADLLISTVLIDTKLKPVEKGGKATEKDLKAVSLLLPFSTFSSSAGGGEGDIGIKGEGGGGGGEEDKLESRLKEKGDFLIKLKEDVSWMNGRDLLRRDYKEYIVAESQRGLKYGLSTVPLGLKVWLDKFEKSKEIQEGVLKDVNEWMKERELSLCGVLTSYTHVKKNGNLGKHRRELLIFTIEEKFDEIVFKGLENDQVLQLEEWKEVENYGGLDQGVRSGGAEGGGESHRYERWKVWQQGNTKATRKQVAPVLKELVTLALSQ